MNEVEEIRVDGEVVAVLLRAVFDEPGVHFITPDEYSQQVGYMRHPQGKRIDPHRHIPHERQVHLTNEVLVVKSGKLRVDLFNAENLPAETRVLGPGDVILLVSGAHGFEVLEEVRMIEVKQGPYVGDADKHRLRPNESATEQV